MAPGYGALPRPRAIAPPRSRAQLHALLAAVLLVAATVMTMRRTSDGAGAEGRGPSLVTASKECSALGQHGQQKCCAGGGCAFKAEGKVCRAITDDNRHVTQPGSAENDCGKDLSKTEEASVDPSRCASFSGTEPANRAKCCGDASCAYTGGKGACVNTDVDPAKRALQGDKCTDKDRASTTVVSFKSLPRVFVPRPARRGRAPRSTHPHSARSTPQGSTSSALLESKSVIASKSEGGTLASILADFKTCLEECDKAVLSKDLNGGSKNLNKNQDAQACRKACRGARKTATEALEASKPGTPPFPADPTLRSTTCHARAPHNATRARAPRAGARGPGATVSSTLWQGRTLGAPGPR